MKNQGLSKIILVEFNELCQPFLEKWMADGVLPNFKVLYQSSTIFQTNVDVEEEVFLEPWIQWFSLHTGRPFSEHGVFHLTDGIRSSVPDVWRILEAAGKSVASFGSMNVRPFAPRQGFFIGDPWSEHEDAFPNELNGYNRFVSAKIREHTNPRAPRRAKESLEFLKFMSKHGLSLATIRKVLSQVLKERTGAAHSYQRVALMDDFQVDVFEKQYQKSAPDFATFFSNSTAHLQHAYWKYMEPEKFGFDVDQREIQKFSGAIKFGYVNLDAILGRLMKLAEKTGARVVFATALSQQACPPEVANGDKSYYRLKDVKDFLTRFGVGFKSVDPTMTHQYLMTFENAEQRELARAKISGMRVSDGKALFEINDWDKENIYFASNSFESTPASEFYDDHGVGHSFGKSFYKIPTTKNGRHHPSGSLWIQGRAGKVHAQQVSILDVLPTVVDMLNVPMPTGSWSGRSLKGYVS